jgi:signal transduction histidine kinase
MALFPFLGLIAVPQILSTPYPIPTWVTMLLLLLIPLSYAYAILRHRLMDLEPVINRSVVFYLLTLILFGLYLAISLGVGSLWPQLFAGPLAAGNVALVALLALLFGPMKQAIQQFVDRVFYGSWYDYEALISHASALLGDTLSQHAIADLLVNDVAQIMHLKAAALLLPEGQHALRVTQSQGFDQRVPLRRDGALANAVLEAGKPVLDETLCENLSLGAATEEELRAWSEDGARVWIPLAQQGELIGLLVLGDKRASDFFYPTDLRMLTSLVQQAGVALARVQLVEELRNQVDEVRALARQVMALQERNQQQMAVEIHAQLLQDLAVADLFLDDAQKAFRPEEVRSAREVLQEMARYLRTVLFELQPPAWDHSDLQTVLEDYIWNFQQRRGLPVAFAVSGSNGAEIPEGIRIAVYRILQESLNNARKHAGASQIRVSLNLQQQRISLEVRDDGVGFDVPAHLGPYVDGGHLGLVSIREWAEEVGGEWQVISEPGQGTQVMVHIPLLID